MDTPGRPERLLDAFCGWLTENRRRDWTRRLTDVLAVYDAPTVRRC